MKTVIFATHVWERDYEIVLYPERFRMKLQSFCFDFSEKVLVLNNFRSEKSRKKALALSDKLVKEGLLTNVLDAKEYLDRETLESFSLDYKLFWDLNPYYSCAQLAALHYSMGKSDFLLQTCGDVLAGQKR